MILDSDFYPVLFQNADVTNEYPCHLSTSTAKPLKRHFTGPVLMLWSPSSLQGLSVRVLPP